MKTGPRHTRKLLKAVRDYLYLFDVSLGINRNANMSELHGIMNQFFHNDEEYEQAKVKWFGLIIQLEDEIKELKRECSYDYYYNYVAQSLAAKMAPYATSMYYLREAMKKWKYIQHEKKDNDLSSVVQYMDAMG